VIEAEMSIPAWYVVTRRTPEFTQDTVPPALLSAHETKGGAWALIHVLEGKLRYCIETPASESILEPGRPGVIQPQVPHHVESVGPVRFYLEFHRAP
jgi:tellurite methyltransferase